MNNEQKYFLDLISSEINGTKVEIYNGEIDWNEIYRLAKIHSLIAITFSAINKLPKECDIPLEIYNKMKKNFLLQVRRNMVVDDYAEKLIKAFNENGLKHLIFKGYILKEYYSAPEYRSMSDIDIFINFEDRQKSYEIMTDLGYKNERQCDDVWTYKKKESYIEMHTVLVEQEIKEDVDFKEYFSNPWEHAEIFKGEYSYTFNKEFHLIYLLVHIAKHFYGCGCGVRMIMDIAVYISKFGDVLDWNYIWTELDKLDLRLFTQNILIICNKWFNTKIDFEYDIDREFYDKLCESILLGGTFGFNNCNFRIAQIRNESKNRSESRRSSLKNVFRDMFIPSYEELIKESRYSFLRGRKYLIGFAWIYRAFYQIKKRGINSIGYILSILKSTKKIDEQKETMNKLGL